MAKEHTEDQAQNGEVEDKKATNTPEEGQEGQEEQTTAQEETEDPTAKLQQEVAEFKDKYLRLYSEFDNYRKRTVKERAEFLKTANRDLILSFLPVLDDLERAEKAYDPESGDVKQLKEGYDLIFHKFRKALEKAGLSPIDNSVGEVFDVEQHEAVTQFPAPSEDMKGKVVDELEKGYMLGDKVIRFSKVVVGA